MPMCKNIISIIIALTFCIPRYSIGSSYLAPPSGGVLSSHISVLNVKTIPKKITISIRIGRTKIGMAIFKNGRLVTNIISIEWKDLLFPARQKINFNELIDFIINTIKRQCLELNINTRDLGKIGISWPGPFDGEKGTSSYFAGSIDLMQIISRTVHGAIGDHVSVEVLSENEAQLRGERNVSYGKLFDKKSGCVLNIATGIGLGIMEDGSFINQAAGRIDGKDFVVKSGLSHIGRVLIRKLDGTWEYRPTIDGSVSRMSKSEIRLTTLLGGVSLAYSFIDAAEKEPGSKNRSYLGLRQTLGEIKNTFSLSRPETSIAHDVLIQLNLLGRKEDPLAVDFIKAVGDEMGNALDALFKAYPEYSFLNHIILSGSVSVNIGRGVNPVNEEDIFTRAIKDACGASSVEYSDLQLEAEFIAFLSEQEIIMREWDERQTTLNIPKIKDNFTTRSITDS